MGADITSVRELIAQAEADPAFLHQLLFEPAKAAQRIAAPGLRGQIAGIDPRTALGDLLGGHGATPVSHCDNTCGSQSCDSTCGAGSCGSTCASSCGNTCGDLSCINTTSHPVPAAGRPAGRGQGGRPLDLDRLRADIDALIAQHGEPRP